MPVEHYENFPVASWLLPARLRTPIEAIYRFARGADDIADEGDLSDAARLHGLDRYWRALDEIEAGRMPDSPPFIQLAVAVQECNLSIALLRDLIDAFRQDVVKKRYATFAELCDYARRSANPIGRLVLECENQGQTPFPGKPGTDPDSPKKYAIPGLSPVLMSDSICTGLQLVNFWQDVGIDWAKGRVYLPQEDLARFDVTEEQIAAQRVDDKWTALMRFECERARAMLVAGMPLAKSVPGRLGLEIRTTVHGGITIADKITAASGDVFRHRPKLHKLDWVRIMAKAAL